MRVALVVVAALVVVGLGFAGHLMDPGQDVATSPLPPTSAPVAAAMPSATMKPTPPATQAPTPAPTPIPTLAPTVAAATAAALVPTGVHVAGLGSPAVWAAVADVDGTIWAMRSGATINVDPRTGRTRTWTLADDPAFAMGFLAPSRQHGVWLVSEEAVRLFDGERFSAVIEAPALVWSMVEDADGTLWAQTDRFGLVRWVDGTWTSDPPGRPTRLAADIVVDRQDRVWTVNYSLDDAHDGEWRARSVSVWDGSHWTNFTAHDLPALETAEWWNTSLIAAGDGGMWLASGGKLARHLGDSWATVDLAEAGIRAPLTAAGGDGRLWFVRQHCDSPCGVRIQVYDGSKVTTYDEQDGLPGADAVGSPGASVLPGPGYVLAATEAGLYRLANGSWRPVAIPGPAGVPATGLTRTGEVTALAALARDEVWATADSLGWAAAAPRHDLLRYDGSAWHRSQRRLNGIAGQAIADPDGALWVATSSGPLVRRDGVWADLGEMVAAVAPDPVGYAEGCGGVVFPGNGGVVYYAGARSANRLVALRRVGGAWNASLHPAPAEVGGCPEAYAVTADGSIWRLRGGWSHVVSRWADGEWQAVSLPPDYEGNAYADASAIVADGEGSLWVAVNTRDPATETRGVDLLELAAGRWIRRGGAAGMEVRALALHPDGSLIAVGDGVAVLRGQRWQPLWHGLRLSAVSVAPDGAVWVAGSNVYRLPPVLR